MFLLVVLPNMLERTTHSPVQSVEEKPLQQLPISGVGTISPLSGETSATLSFTPLRQTTPSSNGQYVCEAMRSGRALSGVTVLL